MTPLDDQLSRLTVDQVLARFRLLGDQLGEDAVGRRCREPAPPNPRYIIDLMKRVTTVSVETMKIVDNLPPLHEAD